MKNKTINEINEEKEMNSVGWEKCKVCGIWQIPSQHFCLEKKLNEVLDILYDMEDQTEYKDKEISKCVDILQKKSFKNK